MIKSNKCQLIFDYFYSSADSFYPFLYPIKEFKKIVEYLYEIKFYLKISYKIIKKTKIIEGFIPYKIRFSRNTI